jgi:hypothetical protein
MSRVPNLGTAEDREQRASLSRNDDADFRERTSAARDLIYGSNYAVTNDQIEAKLKEQSLTPNIVSSQAESGSVKLTFNGGALQNAFSQQLSPFGFNMYPMLVVDLMHEVELGSWRSLFIHLLCILEHEGQGLLLELDRR